MALSLQTRFLLVASLFLFTAASASAQEARRWLFMPVVAGEGDLSPRVASALDALATSAEARGVLVWPREDAARLFEQRHSSESSPLSEEDLRALEHVTDVAVKEMAAQRYGLAITQLETANRLYERSPDELNRRAPRQVLDLCLFQARALIETGIQPATVKERVRDCRLRVPLEIEPNLLTHTNATVRKLLAEVGAELALARNGRLTVRGQPGCAVRVDGVDVGRLVGGTLELSNLIVGKHRVSVVCDRAAARVHAVDVGEAATTLTVDVALDARLRSRPYLHQLQEGNNGEAALARALRTVEQVLGQTRIILVRLGPEGATLQRVMPSGIQEAKLPAPAEVGEVWTAAERERAIDGLMKGSTDPARAGEQQRSTPAQPAAATLSAGADGKRERERWRRMSPAFFALGAVSVATSLGLHLSARQLRNDHEASYDAYFAGPTQTSQDADDVLRARRLGVASLGLTALHAASSGLGVSGVLVRRELLGRRNLAPAVSFGAIGAALIGVGAYAFTGARAACEGCAAERDNWTELAFLLTGQGMGLLIPPLLVGLTHAVGRLGRPKATMAVSSQGLSLRGSF